MGSKSLALLAALAFSTTGLAQEGNGYGNAYLANTPAVLGGSLVLEFGAEGLAHGVGLLSLASSFGPTFLPGIPYALWIDAYDPNLLNIPIQLDAQGHGSLIFPDLPSDPALALVAPMYMYAVLVDTSLPAPALSLTFSKTVRLSFEMPNAYRSTATLATARGFHTATSTSRGPRDNETGVLIAGGAIGSLLAPAAMASTEIYRPLIRGYQPGPTLSIARVAHQSVALPNGQVLIIGGLDATNTATTTCEIFDPATDTLLPAADMSVPRAGHSATLLADGRVLVVGGITTYANALNALPQVLATTQTTAEIFDPATGTWTFTAGTLAAKRMGHGASLMTDGRVLISGGVLGATTVPFPQIGGPSTYPVMTAGCETFNPATGLFTITAPLPQARAFHTATTIPGTGVLVTGGAYGTTDGFTYAVSSCAVYASGGWTASGPLPYAAAFHSAVLRPEGDVLLVGGISGNFTNGVTVARSGVHDGVAFAERSTIGTNPAIPAQTSLAVAASGVTALYDGSYLVSGGWSSIFGSVVPQTASWVFVD